MSFRLVLILELRYNEGSVTTLETWPTDSYVDVFRQKRFYEAKPNVQAAIIQQTCELSYHWIPLGQGYCESCIKTGCS